MKTLKLLSLSIASALILTACGGGSDITPSPISGDPSKPVTPSTSSPMPDTGKLPTPTTPPTPPTPTLKADPDGVTPLLLTTANRRGAAVGNLKGNEVVLNIYGDTAFGGNVKGTNQDTFTMNKGMSVGTLGTLEERADFDVSKSASNLTTTVKAKVAGISQDIPVTYSVRRVEGVTGRVIREDSATKEKVLTDAGKLTVVSNLAYGKLDMGSSGTKDIAVGYISGNALMNIDSILKADRHKATTEKIVQYKGRSDYLAQGAAAPVEGTALLTFNLGSKVTQEAVFQGNGYNIRFTESDFVTTKDDSLKADSLPSYLTKDAETAAEKGMRGYFYGNTGELTAGTFFDQKGVGTFIAADTKLDSTATTISTK